MNSSSSWFPSFGSWMSAILLTLLTGFLGFGVHYTQRLSQFIIENWSSRLGSACLILAILSPIVAIAIVHHLLHLFLDRFFPDSQSTEIDGTTGIFPGMMSWWEGLYGWTVIFISTLITIAIIIAFFPIDESGWAILAYARQLFSWDQPQDFLFPPNIIRVIIAAHLYQIEHLVRCRLRVVRAKPYYSR